MSTSFDLDHENYSITCVRLWTMSSSTFFFPFFSLFLPAHPSFLLNKALHGHIDIDLKLHSRNIMKTMVAYAVLWMVKSWSIKMKFLNLPKQKGTLFCCTFLPNFIKFGHTLERMILDLDTCLVLWQVFLPLFSCFDGFPKTCWHKC
jgi:hypothetical protein